MNTLDNIKKRIFINPLTSLFLICGFTISILIISISISFVSELYAAQDKKNEHTPPNGRQYEIFSGESVDISDIFNGICDGSGIIVNGIIVNPDMKEVNTIVSVSAEWFASDDVWHYPVSEGRYYTAEEIKNGEKLVLIGCNLKDCVYKENGSEYIDIEGEKYQVIGVVGFLNQRSLWDNRLFMPATALPQNIKDRISCHINYILYSQNNDYSLCEEVILSSLHKRDETATMQYIGEINTENVISDFLEFLDEIVIIAAIGYIIAIIFAINITIFWMQSRNREMAIRKALGYKNKDIIKMLIQEMTGLILLSLIFAVILQAVLYVLLESLGGYTLKIYFSNVFIGLLVVMITGVLVSVFPICRIIKIQPKDAIEM